MAAMEKNKTNLNVPNLRFPEFSGEWERHSLGEIGSTLIGLTYSPADVVKEDGVIVLRSSNIQDGEIDYKDLVRVNKKIKDSLFTKKNDILICARNGSSRLIGKNALISDDDTGHSYGAFMMVYRSEDNPFVRQLLCTKRYFAQVRENLGARINQITTSDMNSFEFFFPQSKEERNKIALFLRLIDERISTQKKIIEKYESLIRGISNKLLYESEGASVHLGNILIERSERTKIINQHEVLSSTVKGIFSQREYFSKDIASENNVGYKIIRLHDIVLSPQNLWMGNINYNDKYDIGIVSPSYKIFSIANGYDNRFVATLLKTYRALYNYIQVSEQGASIVRRNLNMEAFEQLTFKIPPYTKQCKIGRLLDSMQKRLDLAISAQNCLELQKLWLLRNLFI